MRSKSKIHLAASHLVAGIAMPLISGLVVSSLVLSCSAVAQTVAPARNSYYRYTPQAGQFPAALQGLVTEVAELPENADATVARALIGKITESRAKFSRGYHDELWFLEGLAQERSGNKKSALSAFEASLRLSNNAPPVLFRKAMVLNDLKRHTEAEAALREFLWLSTRNKHEAHFLLGKVLCSIERCPEGIAELELSLQKVPTYVPALEFLVAEKRKSLELLSDPVQKAQVEAQVAADVTRLFQLDPENREAALTHARFSLRHTDLLIHGDKLIDAERIAKKFAEKSEFKDAEAVRLLFDIYVRRGRTKEASEVLERGLAVDPAAKPLLDARRQLEIQKQVDALSSMTKDQ